MGLITLITDFGSRDWFVGTMKGVILHRAPQATLVDITHQIDPGDIKSAAFALASAFAYFPRGAIHLVVVDPGVGSKRAALAVQTDHGYFLGPDNGVLSWALAGTTVRSIHLLENKKMFLPEISRTFHGRDIFAPAAAHLSCGKPVSQLGRRTQAMQELKWPRPKLTPPMAGEVVYIDHFGNAITNLPNAVAERILRLRISGGEVVSVRSHYQAVPVGQSVVVPGSTGYLEIAVNGGNAAKKLRLSIGKKVAAASRR